MGPYMRPEPKKRWYRGFWEISQREEGMTYLPPIPLFFPYPLRSLRTSESPTPGKVHLPPLTRPPLP